MRRLFRLVVRPPAVEQEIDAEISFHLDEEARARMALGDSPDAAMAEARKRFGNLKETRAVLARIDRERRMQERRASRFADLMQDLGYAFRGFRRQPGFALMVISASEGSDAVALSFLASLPLLIGCLCLLVPVGFVINMIVRQAQNAIVLEDARVLPSLSRGWDIFRSNLGPIIVMAIILAVLGLVAGFIIAIPVFVVVLPAVLTFMAGDGQNWTPLALMGVCLCLYIPVSLLLNGIVVSYTEAAWTLTYMRLVRPQENAPVIIEANA